MRISAGARRLSRNGGNIHVHPGYSIHHDSRLRPTIAETALHNSKLNIRVLAHRYDPPAEPGKILFQTTHAGESVDFGTVVGIVISEEDPYKKPHSP